MYILLNYLTKTNSVPMLCLKGNIVLSALYMTVIFIDSSECTMNILPSPKAPLCQAWAY